MSGSFSPGSVDQWSAASVDQWSAGPEELFYLRYPEYPGTWVLEELRATEYNYLDRNGHVYLDYTGSGLPASAQVRAHTERITGDCFGNPHSKNLASEASAELVEQTRAAILSYFNASRDEYAVIFTPNATGACRLVGESYPFEPGRGLVMTLDNHNSVNGIREFARAAGADVAYIPFASPELRIDAHTVGHALRAAPTAWAGERRSRGISRGLTRLMSPPRQMDRARSASPSGRRGLFAFPAQSNFTGVQHSLEWIEIAHGLGYDVLMDAAAFVPTNRLDLGAVQPDFVPVSWYKMFGHPTGVGCLLARREALSRLRRPWFAGGTIQVVSVHGDFHIPCTGEAAYEDGTVNFLSIPDVGVGLSWINQIGIDTVHLRVTCLVGWLLERLTAMRHRNGDPAVRVYGPSDTEMRGGTVAFNFLDPSGKVVDERIVSRDAGAERISLRTGCFCNPGAMETALALSPDVLAGIPDRDVPDKDAYIEMAGMPSGGAIRVSVGIVSTFSDVERFLQFAERTYVDRYPDTAGFGPRTSC